MPGGEPGAAAHAIRVCVGSSCTLNLSHDLLGEVEDRVRRYTTISVGRCGCLGHCEEGPNMTLDGRVHLDMDPQRLQALIDELTDGGTSERW